jgi:hypothetical protein
MLSDLDRVDDALKSLETVRATGQYTVEILADMASLLLYLARYDESISLFDDLIELQPDNVWALGYKGHALRYVAI